MDETRVKLPKFILKEEEVRFVVGQNTYQIVKTEKQSPTLVPSVPIAFCAAPFEGIAIVRGPEMDWAFMPVESDPLSRGKYPVPRSVLRKLKAIAVTGIEFDRLYVAHEMERGAQPTWDVLCPPLHPSVKRRWELLTPPSIKLAMGIAKAMVWTVWHRQLQACKAMDKTIQERIEQRKLDPILFGVNVDRTGMASWHVLAEWVW